MSETARRARDQRAALRRSQREAAGSSIMSGVCDNYLGAFAIFLNATAQQISWVVAIPQLVGAWAQLISVWLARLGVQRVRLTGAGDRVADHHRHALPSWRQSSPTPMAGSHGVVGPGPPTRKLFRAAFGD